MKIERPKTDFQQLDYLVTGTGRCGTVWFARMLTHNGRPCGHECIFDVGGIKSALEKVEDRRAVMSVVSSHWKDEEENWHFMKKWWESGYGLRGDASYMAAPFINHKILSQAKKIHLVRNPFKVVDSFCNGLGFFANAYSKCEWEWFIYQHVSEVKERLAPIDRACLYYTKWIDMIEECEDVFVHRIEDGLNDRLANYLEVDKLKDPPVIEGGNNDKFGKSGRSFVSASQISSGEIQRMFISTGEKYGYDMQSGIRKVML